MATITTCIFARKCPVHLYETLLEAVNKKRFGDRTLAVNNGFGILLCHDITLDEYAVIVNPTSSKSPS